MRSNNSILTVILGLLFSITTHAQTYIGAKIGANFADTRVDGLIGNLAPDQTTFTGFTAGIVAEIQMKNGFSFRPELNYIQKGFTVAQNYDVNVLGIDMPLGGKAKTRVNYIEMPLLLKYSYGTETAKVYALAGPSIGYATSAELRPVATLLLDFNLPVIPINLDNDIYNKTEISGVLGIGGEIKAGNGKLFTDVRYNLGFTNMLNNPIVDIRIKNQGVNLSAGYAFMF